MLISKRKFRRLITIAIIIIVFLFIYNQIFSDTSANSIIIDSIVPNSGSVYSLVYEYKYGIYFYNMNEPTETWWTFECIETKMRLTMNTRLCIHEPKFDQHVSGQLKLNGLWEPNNVRSFIKQMQETPDASVIDIGANIGLYTLIAAKYNRSVIAVEPLHENMIRIHKAAHLENVQSNIIALVNAISNERKQLKVNLLDNNLGGSYVIQDEALKKVEETENFSLTRSSVIVNSILLDDLVDVINHKLSKKNKSKKFIIKMDIEGYEAYAFEKSDKLFSKMQIVAIYLEIGKMVEKIKKLDDTNDRTYMNKVLNMLNKFKTLNYEPYEVNGYNKLEYNQWRHWPWDVYLRHCDHLVCPGREPTVRG